MLGQGLVEVEAEHARARAAPHRLLLLGEQHHARPVYQPSKHKLGRFYFGYDYELVVLGTGFISK